jgi:superoxide reductase
MIQRGQVYKCSVCGNIVEVLYAGGGDLVCCGQPMDLLTEKSGDEGTEKHTPVVEEHAEGVIVKVGSIPHPMEDKHYIQWIEVATASKAYREYLTPGSKPEATFPVKKSDIIAVREYCNIHGLWKA